MARRREWLCSHKAMEILQQLILDTLNSDGSIPDTRQLDLHNSLDDPQVSLQEGQVAIQAALSSLQSHDILEYRNHDDIYYQLKPEAVQIVNEGSHGYRVWAEAPAPGQGSPLSASDIAARVGPETAKLGQMEAMKLRWLKKEGGGFVKAVESVTDVTRDRLKEIQRSGNLVGADSVIKDLKRRNLLTSKKSVWFSVSKGSRFRTTVPKLMTDLTVDMLASQSWKNANFKQYNFQAAGTPTNGGALHPLLKVRAEFRSIFLEMGFSEMPTSQFVESCFWNFDALFVPQQHPARDVQDTFYLSDPAISLPIEASYYTKVAKVHSEGGFGSLGYRAPWSDDESRKLVLRTHTTARSSYMLKLIASQPGGFKPTKLFSIDRVFRNEATDNTHLAEFHQVEGVVADYGLTLPDLMGLIQTFFSKMGLENLRFKPAYNPYTEPSLEIFAFHPALNKWVEIGNAGMFRPEMLEPMGVPKGVRAHGWGLSLERPTMIRYGINNIRTLVGHKVNIDWVEDSAAVRF